MLYPLSYGGVRESYCGGGSRRLNARSVAPFAATWAVFYAPWRLFCCLSRSMGFLVTVSSTSLSKLSGGRRKKTYERGRVCLTKGCETVLSAYNKNDYCWQHFQPVPRPARIPGPPNS